MVSESLVKKIVGFAWELAYPFLQAWVAKSETQWDDIGLKAVKSAVEDYLKD